MIPKHRFPIPDGVVAVYDDYQLNLAHYELLQLKPRGTVLFSGEAKEIRFQFFAGEARSEGIFARLDEPMGHNTSRIFSYLETHSRPRVESLITISLLQFRLLFIAPRLEVIFGAPQKTIRFEFPSQILKTHRRKFIRIPFNENFPASLRFQTDNGPVVRKLKDLSREGMRILLEPGDELLLKKGKPLKQAVLKLLDKEIPLGVSVASLHSSSQAGLRMIAATEEDKVWIKDIIRVLMKQILNLNDPRFDDQIEKDE